MLRKTESLQCSIYCTDFKTFYDIDSHLEAQTTDFEKKREHQPERSPSHAFKIQLQQYKNS